jgi:carboxymethylenebutenolidase
MLVECHVVDLGALRCRVFTPVHARLARWPAVIAYSDIFQHTGSHLRLCTRLASHGFVVLSPELYGRLVPAGTVLRFEEDRERALELSSKLELEWIDADLRATIDFARTQPSVDMGRLLTCGWCIGGHLAFRAARASEVTASVCFYATGLHTDTLGAARGTATTLANAKSIAGELLLVWGSRDPHIPAEGRQRVHAALANAGTHFQSLTFDAEHAFMRDEGPRWNAAAADHAFAAMLVHFEPWRVG